MDHICGYCGSYNPDTSTICKSCGAKRSENEKNYFDVQNQKRALNNHEQAKEQFQKKLNIDESTQYEELRSEPENNVSNLKINNHIKSAIAILLSIILIKELLKLNNTELFMRMIGQYLMLEGLLLKKVRFTIMIRFWIIMKLKLGKLPNKEFLDMKHILQLKI